MFNFLNPWMWVGIIVFILGVFGYGYYEGTQNEREKQLVIAAKSLEDALDLAGKQAALTLESERKAWESQERTKTVVRKVTKVIREEKPSNSCDLSNGWLQRHNESATNTLPAAPRIDYEAYSGVTADRALEAIAGNYGTCHEIRDIAVQCQGWIKGQLELNKNRK